MILGEGQEQPSLEALVRKLSLEEDVVLPGFVQNPFPFMARAAVFVLSSAWEGLPNVLIQAMAMGTPVVATDCKSGPAEILKGGKYGQLVPVGDAISLSAAIHSALEKPFDKEALITRAKRFSLEIITDEFLELLTTRKQH